MKYKWILLGTAFCFVLFGWLVYRQLTPSFVPPKLPVPNGFDDLLRAAEMLHPRTGFYEDMEAEELAEVVAHNKPALQLAREALEKEIAVPVDWKRDPAEGLTQSQLDEMSHPKTLCRAFSAETQIQQHDGQTKEAIALAIDNFRLGKKCYHGGLIGHFLVGVAIQGQATNELRQLVVDDPSLAEEILIELLPQLDMGQSIDEVLQRESDYIQSATRGYTGFMVRLNFMKVKESLINSAQPASFRTLAHQRLFVLHLAMQVFKDKHGTYPAELKDLNPEILESIPEDPYSDGPFIYRNEGDSYQLFSVGQNKHDDGGQGDPKESGLGLDVLFNLDLKE